MSYTRLLGNIKNQVTAVPLLFFASWITAFLSIGETFVSRPVTVYMTVLTICHIVAILLLPFMTYSASIVVFFVFFISVLLPDKTGPSQFLGVWLALICIACVEKPFIAWLWPTIATSGRMIESALLHIPISNYFLLIASFYLSFLIGLYLRWKEDEKVTQINKLQIMNMEKELEQTHRNIALASQLHDAVTSNLTYLALVLDKNSESETTSYSSEVLARMREKTIDILQEVRQIVNILSDGISFPYGDQKSSFESMISIELYNGDKTLNDLGFNGSGVAQFHSDLLSFDENAQRAVLGLLRELYTNTAVYAEPGSDAYMISVESTSQELSITQINGIAMHRRFIDKPKSGKGLNFHRQRILQLDGTINIQQEDSTWILHARIPIPSSTNYGHDDCKANNTKQDKG
jgi:signal transduction histidine kinase